MRCMQLPPQCESLTPRCPPRRTYNLSASNGNQTARVNLNPGLFQREGIGVVSQLQNNNNSAGAIPIRIKMLLMLGRRTSLRIRHHPQGWKRGCLSVSLRFFILFASLFFCCFARVVANGYGMLHKQKGSRVAVWKSKKKSSSPNRTPKAETGWNKNTKKNRRPGPPRTGHRKDHATGNQAKTKGTTLMRGPRAQDEGRWSVGGSVGGDAVWMDPTMPKYSSINVSWVTSGSLDYTNRNHKS